MSLPCNRSICFLWSHYLLEALTMHPPFQGAERWVAPPYPPFGVLRLLEQKQFAWLYIHDGSPGHLATGFSSSLPFTITSSLVHWLCWGKSKNSEKRKMGSHHTSDNVLSFVGYQILLFCFLFTSNDFRVLLLRSVLLKQSAASWEATNQPLWIWEWFTTSPA